MEGIKCARRLAWQVATGGELQRDVVVALVSVWAALDEALQHWAAGRYRACLVAIEGARAAAARAAASAGAAAGLGPRAVLRMIESERERYGAATREAVALAG